MLRGRENGAVYILSVDIIDKSLARKLFLREELRK